VAQVAMGANQNQTLKAFAEAEAYHGPSMVICYSPCINHGIKGGLSGAQAQQKKAVECGYWHLYRFNPLLKAEGKNPFTLDSKEPTTSFTEFLMSEVRYSSLLRKFSQEKVDAIFASAEISSKERLDSYKKMAINLEA
jgi:pyruvate-ferredoxin/flavodoxin oxidoreductase